MLDESGPTTRAHALTLVVVVSNNGLRQRSVRSASRSHFAGKGSSKGPQTKAACPSVASALYTQPPHDPHSQTLAAPVPTFLAPPTTPAETPKSGSTTAEARPCSALRELRPRRGDDPKRLLPALCRRRRMATKLGARSRTGEAFRRVRTFLFMSSSLSLKAPTACRCAQFLVHLDSRYR